jgi:serine phosphatase RsbU (regulator of sigma subunit)
VRPRALLVGALSWARPTSLLAAFLDVEPVAASALSVRLSLPPVVDLTLLDGRLPLPTLRKALRAVGPPETRPPVLVAAPRGRERPLEAALAALLAGPADAVVSGSLGEAELLCRVRAALRVRSVLAELQRKNAALAELQSRLEGISRRMAEELRLAANLQRGLLPPPFKHPRLELAREFMPFREIGGDYYDLVELGAGRLALAIGDVMGKGVPAALLSANLRTTLRSQLQDGSVAADEVVARVNQLFWQVTPKGRFASFFLAILDLERSRVEYVNAGHPCPFVVRRDGDVTDLASEGTALGLLEHARYERHELELEPEDLLVFYSDGVTERSNLEDELFGIERLRAACVKNRGDSARIILYTLLGEVQGWSAGTPPEDDLTLIVGKGR